MNKDLIVKTLNSKELKELFFASNIISVSLFGSFARGDNKENSDIDLLIETDENGVVTVFDLYDLKEKLKDKLKYDKIDLISPKSGSNRFYDTIKDDLIKII